ncbi:hypothetical protein SAMN05446635_6692 [Burkholderia sp. OK233]|nr:hypothetical protein SAMN05446635_6692 [Burkholderia sp. OK233]
MFWLNSPDTHTRADLLTYLVVSQLIRRRLTGKWLTAQHVVQSTHLWMCANGGIDLLQRVALGSCAQALATHVMQVSKVRFDAMTFADAFVDHVHLDYQSRAVVEVYHTCTVHLMSRSRASGRGAKRDRQ